MKKSPGIRYYLIISHSLLVVISLIAIGLLWSQNEYRIITTEVQSLVRERASLIASVAGHELTEQGKIDVDDISFSPNTSNTGLLVVFVDRGGFVTDLTSGKVNSSDLELFQKLYRTKSFTGDSYTELIHIDSKRFDVYASAQVYGPDSQVLGTICLLLPMNKMEGYIARQRMMLIGWITMIGLLGIGLSIILANYFARHFSEAQRLARTVSDGNYDLRIPESGPRELRDLSHYLNDMAARLNEQASLRQRLLSNVTHELARPLAGLRLGIESLRKGALRDLNLADDMLVGMAKAITNLEGLIDDIALAARPSSVPITLNCTAVVVEPLLRGAAIRYLTMAETHDVYLEVNVGDNLPPIYADEKRVNQILGNLLHNAIKFTPIGKSVNLSAERDGTNAIRIIVRDCGPGIKPEEAAYIFEPFYQGENGHRVKQGMGLGLAIARQLAEAHNGSLFLENHPDGGAVAVLILPAASS